MTPTGEIIAYAIWFTRFNIAFSLASLTMLIFDYLLTLDHEVELIWKADWNLGKVLFLLTRYLPYVDTSMVLYYQLSPRLTKEQCAISYEYSAWMFVIGITVAELLLTIRTWAIWEKDKRLAIALSLFFSGFWVIEYIVVALYLKTLHHSASALQPLVACSISHINKLLSISWLALMVYDTGIFALIVVQALRTFRLWGNVLLLRVIYRDGIIYFAYLFCLSLLNVIIILMLPREFDTLLSLLERIVHSLLTCRIILHIRALDARNTRPQDIEEMSLKDLTV